MIANQKTTFQWDNFNTIRPALMGSSKAKHSIRHSAYGTFQKLEADDKVCSGRLEFYDFEDNFLVSLIDCVWFEDHQFVIQDGDWIRFNFSLSIDVDMHLSDDQSVKIVRPSWRIINYPPDQTVVETIPANKRSAWITICCKKSRVEELTEQQFENLPSLLREEFPLSDQQSFHNFHDFTSRLNAITADILKTDLRDALRMAYIRARAVELVCLALDHVINSPVNIKGIRLSENDEEALVQAKEILLSDFSSVPSVSELSRQLGINRNKLFYGFKIKYGCSVSEFIQTQRLEEGKRLLQHTNKSISDISHHIGFNHQSNFTTAMKKHFGLTPKQFRD